MDACSSELAPESDPVPITHLLCLNLFNRISIDDTAIQAAQAITARRTLKVPLGIIIAFSILAF